MRIGFIGLGNVGGKLAGSLLRNNFNLTVRDLDQELVNEFVKKGSQKADSPIEVAEQSDVIITCLPHPKISAEVMEGENGILGGLSKGKVWLEMSTTDQYEVKRLGKKVILKDAEAVDCPVSGGCHRILGNQLLLHPSILLSIWWMSSGGYRKYINICRL